MWRQMKFVTLSICALSIPVLADAQPVLDGSWWLVETSVRGGGNDETNPNPPPQLLMITNGHYSLTEYMGERPEMPSTRAAFSSERSAELDELRLEAFRTFRANAGTLDVTDSTFTLNFVLSMNPGAIGLRSSFDYTYDGAMLTLSRTRDDGVTTSRVFARREP